MELDEFSSQVAQSAIDIITPVMESAVVLSGHYAKACGRNTILAKDMEYCLKYCAMHTVGQQIGSYFPDMYEDENSEDEELSDNDKYLSQAKSDLKLFIDPQKQQSPIENG